MKSSDKSSVVRLFMCVFIVKCVKLFRVVYHENACNSVQQF